MKNCPEDSNKLLDTAECQTMLLNVRKYAARQFPKIPMDRLQDAITDGALRAAETFDTSFGTAFKTHLNNVLRRALFDAHKCHTRHVRLGRAVDLDSLEPLPRDDDAHSLVQEDLRGNDAAAEVLEQRASCVNSALQGVPDRDKRIFLQYYGKQATCRELAKLWDLKKSRVQQLAAQVMTRVRAYLVTHKESLEDK